MTAQLEVSIDIAGVSGITAAMVERARDLREPMDEIGRDLIGSTTRRFDFAKGPDGTPWAKLAPSTIKEKERLGFGGAGILMRTGTLKHALSQTADSNSVTVTNIAPYAAIHQFGGTIVRHAHTVLNSFLYFRDRRVTGKKKDGTEYTFMGKAFAKAPDPKNTSPWMTRKSITAMATRVSGAGETVMPARPFMGIDDADLAKGAGVITRFLMGASA